MNAISDNPDEGLEDLSENPLEIEEQQPEDFTFIEYI